MYREMKKYIQSAVCIYIILLVEVWVTICRACGAEIHNYDVQDISMRVSIFLGIIPHAPGSYTTSQLRMLPYTAARHSAANSVVDDLLTQYDGAVNTDAALDLGCGNGVKTFPLCRYFSHVYGVDASPAMLADAAIHAKDPQTNKLTLSTNGTPVKFLQGDFAKIPLEARSVDVVTMWNSLHFAVNGSAASNDCSAVIDELARVLRPSGVVFISEPGVLSKYDFSKEAAIVAEKKLKHKLAQIEAVRASFMANSKVKVIKYTASDMGYILICQIISKVGQP
jgi:ubiquinone/menaquinone biosynthesis C-methylase UbiE